MSQWFEGYGFAEVADGLLIGAYPQDADDVAALADAGVTRVYNLVQDSEYEQGGRDSCVTALDAAGIQERRMELADFGNLLPGQIERTATAVGAWLRDGERVFLHCRAGWQRSAAMAAAAIALNEGVSLDDALAAIRDRKPSADPLPHQRDDLKRWWELRGRRRQVDGDDADLRWFEDEEDSWFADDPRS